MLELLFCSLLTVFPDYLFRRYRQGKRLGHEITFYSVWYELRWGITCCVLLTVGLITLVFYTHPATSNVTMFFRTAPILPEGSGRVAEIYTGFSGRLKEGDPIFRLDSSKQQAAIETGKRKIAEVDADLLQARIEVAKATAQIQEARSTYQQAVDELDTKRELKQRNSGTVPEREIERLQLLVEGRKASLAAVTASKDSAEARVSSVLPSEKASAEAALAQAQVDLDKTVVRAGVGG